ncbi:anticodon-binding protein [Scleroderma yunnanense]
MSLKDTDLQLSSPLIQPSLIKNKAKRQEVANKQKKAKGQENFQKRLARAKQEANDPAPRRKRVAENVPCKLDNAREHDPSMLPTSKQPSSSVQAEELNADLASDPFATYFNFMDDPHTPPKVLITTSPKASKATYDFCDELVGVFPGAEYIRRKKGKGFEVGRIAGWAAGRGYKHLVVVNEDMKKPNAITLVHLPNGPTAYLRLTSVELTKQIYGHARATPHPELVLNNFATSLGHAGRQVVTLHNQRDFLFFRRHCLDVELTQILGRYAFRSPEKVALQEIGPRFTLKLRWLKGGLPEVHNFGASPEALEITTSTTEESAPPPEEVAGREGASEDEMVGEVMAAPVPLTKNPPKDNEHLWRWKPELETSRRTFFL